MWLKLDKDIYGLMISYEITYIGVYVLQRSQAPVLSTFDA